MTKLEFLQAAASICETLCANNLDPCDIRYLQMVKDYERMKQEGQKYSFIVFYLSQQYGIAESSVYRVVRRLNEECKL